MPEGTLRFPATMPAFEEASGELRRTLDAHGVRDRGRYNVELVFDEIVGNIIRHGAPEDGTCAIEVSLAFPDKSVVMHFRDNGRAFDPRTQEVRALPESLDEAAVGGLGLLLVHNAAQCIEYERTGEETNHLTITVAAP